MGIRNTGTRFGKFMQAAAATTAEEKFSDARQVHLLTGVCPTTCCGTAPQVCRAQKRSCGLPTGMVLLLDQSIRISFRIRNTSTDRSEIRMSWCDGKRCAIGKTALKSRNGSTAYFDYLAITTVVQELLSLGRSRLPAMRIRSDLRFPRTMGQ